MMTVAIFASVTSGAIVSADGVMPAPMIATLSLTISSCAMRLARSAAVPSSLMMSSILRPATVQLMLSKYRFIALRLTAAA